MFKDIAVGDRILVSVDTWFIAPDGRQYRAVFGTFRGCATAENTLGVKTNAKSTNWYMKIGNMVIAGCQIHYVMKSKLCNLSTTPDWCVEKGEVIKYEVKEPRVWHADKE